MSFISSPCMSVKGGGVGWGGDWQLFSADHKVRQQASIMTHQITVLQSCGQREDSLIPPNNRSIKTQPLLYNVPSSFLLNDVKFGWGRSKMFTAVSFASQCAHTGSIFIDKGFRIIQHIISGPHNPTADALTAVQPTEELSITLISNTATLWSNIQLKTFSGIQM